MALESDLVTESLSLLSPADRRRYRWAVATQMSTALLDLLGVLLLGMVGVLAAASTQGVPPSGAVGRVVGWLGMSDWPVAKVAIVLGAVAMVILIAKGVLTLILTRRVTVFLTKCSARLSARLGSEFFSLPVVRVQSFESQTTGFALSHGVTGAVVDVLTNAMTVKVEVTLLAVLSGALLLVDPLTSVCAIAYFGVVIFVFNRRLSGWARRAGQTMAETDVASISTVYDTISTYREITVAHRRAYFIERFSELRRQGAGAYADQQYFGVLPRYGMEIAMVIGAGLLVTVLLTTSTVEAAAGSLLLFLAAASRVMPSLLRLNGARIALHSLRTRAEFALDLAAFIDEHSDEVDHGVHGWATESQTEVAASTEQGEFPAALETALEVKDLVVVYPGTSEAAVRDVSLELPVGGRLALVGPSGAGKSTLADAILGVVRPTAGVVRIGGVSPAEAVRRHPGVIAYVPQQVALVSGTVRENVALGLEPKEVDDAQVWAALEDARLASFLRDSRRGLDTEVGERGVMLSGGQRQRLGIARALFTNPRLLVMDEATSALDAETEHLITETLDLLGPEVTTVTVAHRLATIRQADLVVYLEDGHILAQGTFDEVRAAMPQFDRQANLLGL